MNEGTIFVPTSQVRKLRKRLVRNLPRVVPPVRELALESRSLGLNTCRHRLNKSRT